MISMASLGYLSHDERIVTFKNVDLEFVISTRRWEKLGRPAWMHVTFTVSGDHESEVVPLQQWEIDRLPVKERQ